MLCAVSASLALIVLSTQSVVVRDGCRRISAESGAVWLNRADSAVGRNRLAGAVLHFHSMEGTVMNFQSDRWYPPFFSAMSATEVWLEPISGIERTSATAVFPGSGPGCRTTKESAGFCSVSD